MQGLAGVRAGPQVLQYRQLVGALNDVAHHKVDTWLTEQTDMTEPYVARCLSQMLPSGGSDNLYRCAHLGKRMTALEAAKACAAVVKFLGTKLQGLSCVCRLVGCCAGQLTPRCNVCLYSILLCCCRKRLVHWQQHAYTGHGHVCCMATRQETARVYSSGQQQPCGVQQRSKWH